MKKSIINVTTGILLSLLVIFVAFGIVVVNINGARKPAIYLYPLEDSLINVELKINGFLTKTNPNYGKGWNVFATKEGLINWQYDYLFYEAKLLKIDFPNTGWVVEYKDLNFWFDLNLVKLGLNEKEKNQFKEYWLKELPESNYYEIKLADEEFLKNNMALDITPKPQTEIRLLFGFKPVKEKSNLPEPIVKTPERLGFTVVEWGGIIED